MASPVARPAKLYRRLGRSDRRFGPTLYQNGLCRPLCQWARRPRAALARALARNHARQSSLEYAGLRGEGSTPVPLPPPSCFKAVFSGRTRWQLSPIAVAISNLSSGLPNGRTALLFSERSVSLRTSRLHRFGTVLEIRSFRVTWSFTEKRFGNISRIGKSLRFPN